MNYELAILSRHFDWESLESDFAWYYYADNECSNVLFQKIVQMIWNYLNGTFGNVVQYPVAAWGERTDNPRELESSFLLSIPQAHN